MGEVADTAILLGLHREKVPNSATPFFLHELRVRFCEQIYAHDKVGRSLARDSIFSGLWLTVLRYCQQISADRRISRTDTFRCNSRPILMIARFVQPELGSQRFPLVLQAQSVGRGSCTDVVGAESGPVTPSYESSSWRSLLGWRLVVLTTEQSKVIRSTLLLCY